MNMISLFRPSPVWQVPDATPPAPQADTTAPTSSERLTVDAGWTPYAPDSAKNAAENLEAKAVYDARAPEGHDVNVKLEPKPAAADPNKPVAPAAPAPVAPSAPLLLTDLVAPEGYNIDPAMGTELLTTLNQFANDPKGLANELIKLQVKALATDDESRSQGWDATQTAWKKQSEIDPEIGGAKHAAIVSSATEIGARFGGAKLQEALDLTGMGNHPEWLRFVSKIAPFVSEAGPVSMGSSVAAGKQFSPTNLYPDQGKK